MAPSPLNTPTRGGMFKTVGAMDHTFTPRRRMYVQQLPPVQESSMESIEGRAPLATTDPSDPFAALRPMYKNTNNSPSASSGDFSTVKNASQSREPTGLQSNIPISKDDQRQKMLADSTQSNAHKLDPTTAEFRPAAAFQSPNVYALQVFQNQNNATFASKTFQPRGIGSPNSFHSVIASGPNTFAPHTGVVSNQTSNGTPNEYTTFPAQIGGSQAQLLIPFPKNNGVTVVNGTTSQTAPSGTSGTIGVTYGGPNGNMSQQQQQQQQQTNIAAMTFAVPNGSGVQPNVNMNHSLTLGDGNAPQRHANTSETTFAPPHDSVVPKFNNMNGLNSTNFTTRYGNGDQQHDNGAQNMPMANPLALNDAHNNANVMAPVSTDSIGRSLEQASMSALQAHLDLGRKYPQAQLGPTPALPQGPTRPSQYSNEFTSFQLQDNAFMRQHETSTPMGAEAGTHYGQPAPVPSASMYSSPGGTFTPSQYMASPSYRGRTDPRSSHTHTTAMTEPPPRFALQTPVPVQQQVYSNVISSPSAGAHLSPDRTAASPERSSSNFAVDPFNGPPLPGVIQPIEPQTAMVLYESAVPVQIRNMRSEQLNELTAGPTGRPRREVALDAANFPFIESARNAQPTIQCGVVKLKNIPFGTKRAEVLAFLGRNSKVLNDSQEPVHIIMERVTSRTNDAYVEFMSMQAAVNAVEKHQKTVATGRLSRLGDRPIEVELSSQSALMKDLFPLAKGVRWEGSVPVILEDHPSEPWNCFKGFVSDEEMAMLVKHVEVPQRSPFSRDCPQRPFECMISTLRKLPWYKTEGITIKQRHSVYSACIQLIRLLQHALKERKNEDHLTPQLLKRLWTSAMLCHGFTVTMKDNIAYQVDLAEDRLREFNMPRFANMWVHVYTLCPKPGTPLDVLEYYIAIIREETHRTVSLQQPNIQAQIHNEGTQTNLYWGFFFKELNLPHGPEFDNMTLSRMAELEFCALTNIISRAFG
ncbi:hypothetical protein J7T55_012166 [Diaporthe amygdali]|uniref:uncharacterized protein n=1 Tax=Phomopsis amygdali TaxID=1214568 RepID=UPI0022FDC63D|nr:uncharacterized protein J7T55_012166 [Diaporthe amygdali]KAJ0123697.1 hypothetical protein J7T55_012166 [Diaporthe amygdali]